MKGKDKVKEKGNDKLALSESETSSDDETQVLERENDKDTDDEENEGDESDGDAMDVSENEEGKTEAVQKGGKQLRAEAKAYDASVARSKAECAKRIAEARAAGRLQPLFDVVQSAADSAEADRKADKDSMTAAMAPVTQLAGSMEALVKIKADTAALEMRKKQAETEAAEAVARKAKAEADLLELQLKQAQSSMAKA